ncbi:precorrin-6y C5,15-methyltransferase (decarboxylating) subunit CbiE [Natronosporangium hydrolyticum]|uniref:Precorrin-6y C5,15-methyltransferase (Decarboxylating) subunit CbiE n=1 Tax=Natronosporangium hydrolyticum TaxID=2811111 RepID=A0A895Y918_9ACTN|nr:precorrin-6y C5,15-methyltransferase (decarboxylating) subunit CbiE [Natronosporangium hydrolyticum]QSB12762.1 precorrin-6y C5,15-methyltransferase (decarboxylating) subunit CbiE [Natronosporangium hydrolyticum]
MSTANPDQPVSVVGIGADGWAGLPDPGRTALAQAEVILGGRRQLALLPADLPAQRVPWPTPLLPALPTLLDDHSGQRLCVLASGDPLWFGIGAHLVRLLGRDRVRVLPHLSAITLACSRLGWPVEQVTVRSAVARDLDRVRRELVPGRLLLVLSPDATTPATLAQLLVDAGYGPSELTVLAALGSEHEQRIDGHAQQWHAGPADDLNIVAVRTVAAPDTRVLSTTPGLPDDAFEHDGALTKREARASALSRLAPTPGELLWDVGAGSGSIAVEWLRTDPTTAAIAIENRAERADRIIRNARTLGVPQLRVVRGRAPAALADLPSPDAVFVGGGLTAPELFDAVWAALRPGGRLVAHAITLEGERALVDQAARHGGDLTRLSVERAGPLGSFTGWAPARPVVQWAVSRP